MNKGKGKRLGSNGGFVALLFVLTTASFLTMLVYGLSRSFAYALTMMDSFRSTDRARSSVLYCKHKLYNATLLDIEYEPVLNVDVLTPYESACRYDSFRRAGASLREAVISSRPRRESSQILHAQQDFIIKYTYSVNDELHDYVNDIQTVQVQ